MSESRFNKWLARVDAILLNLCGLDTGSLPDMDYYSMFEDEYTPKEAAMEALSEI